MMPARAPQMEDMMDMVQSGAVKALELRDKQEELRQTDQAYIQVCSCSSAAAAATPWQEGGVANNFTASL